MASQFQLTAQWLGELDYQAALLRQLRDAERATERFRMSGSLTVLGVEHPDVITLGKRGHEEADLSQSRSWLDSAGVPVISVDRGGQATLHSRGQLVIYPILPLRSLGIGARAYIQLLESATLAFLKELGVSAHSGAQEPGLYTENGKIAFFGVRIQNGVSRHGISINVNNDLSRFSWIRSCGRTAERFDRIAAYTQSAVHLALESLFRLWIQEFEKQLKEKIEPSQRSTLDDPSP